MAEKRVKPIFKWPGGKYRLLDAILKALPDGDRLVEPFVGSGAVFMNTRYAAYLLCDLNPDIVSFYQILAKRGDAFIASCRRLFSARSNRPDEYYRRRDRFNRLARSKDERAALFLYLNRHGYNGLVRYNANGAFNVPFGRHAKPYFPAAEMAAFVEKARTVRVEFGVADFRKTFAAVRAGDVVYCDPPYIPLSATSNFTAYASGGFAAAEQADLARFAERAALGGAKVLVSNHDGAEARRLYRNASAIDGVTVRRSISCNGEKRGLVGEVLASYW